MADTKIAPFSRTAGVNAGFFGCVLAMTPLILPAGPSWGASDPGVQHSSVPPQSFCPETSLAGFDPAPLAALLVPGTVPATEAARQARLRLFCVGLTEFRQQDTFADDGLGPTMNLDSCVGCHAYPTSGGSSPPHTIGNPQLLFLAGHKTSTNHAPSFITADGPVREARFINTPAHTPDGGVHDIFTVAGLPDAEKCTLKQPDFDAELKKKNVIFRIPTPLFGTGLMEQIEDREIRANLESNAQQRYGREYGIRPFSISPGHLNTFKEGHLRAFIAQHSAGRSKPVDGGTTATSDNDGTIARFGWKAQNKSLLVFAGEAYNVEMGISNELFGTERNETPGCTTDRVPNDVTDPVSLSCSVTTKDKNGTVSRVGAVNPIGLDCDNEDPEKVLTTRYNAYSDIEKFAAFMRYLAPPAPSPDQPGGATSIEHGRKIFGSIGCANCHTPVLHTSDRSIGGSQPVALFSDIALHDMGSRLSDGITQGRAGPRDFRSAPLWGLSGREYLLHDGRANNLIDAIDWHYSKGEPGRGGSEANEVALLFRKLPDADKQDLLNFLRSL